MFPIQLKLYGDNLLNLSVCKAAWQILRRVSWFVLTFCNPVLPNPKFMGENFIEEISNILDLSVLHVAMIMSHTPKRSGTKPNEGLNKAKIKKMFKIKTVANNRLFCLC